MKRTQKNDKEEVTEAALTVGKFTVPSDQRRGLILQAAKPVKGWTGTKSCQFTSKSNHVKYFIERFDRKRTKVCI